MAPTYEEFMRGFNYGQASQRAAAKHTVSEGLPREPRMFVTMRKIDYDFFAQREISDLCTSMLRAGWHLHSTMTFSTGFFRRKNYMVFTWFVKGNENVQV